MVLNLQQVVVEVLVPQVVHQLQALLEVQVVLVNNIQFQELLRSTLVVVGVLVLQVVKVAAVEEETETKVVAQVDLLKPIKVVAEEVHQVLQVNKQVVLVVKV